MIYRAMSRSILDYGCVVFGSAAKSVICKLARVQAKALRVCNGTFRMTSIPVLLIEMRELPLEIWREKLGLNYWAKLSCSSFSSASRCLLESSWEFSGNGKKINFLHCIKQLDFGVECQRMAGDFGVECQTMAEHVWSLVPPWYLPEPEVLLSLFKEGRNSQCRDVRMILNQFQSQKDS